MNMYVFMFVFLIVMVTEIKAIAPIHHVFIFGNPYCLLKGIEVQS